jgi:hypothetical protein
MRSKFKLYREDEKIFAPVINMRDRYMSGGVIDSNSVLSSYNNFESLKENIPNTLVKSISRPPYRFEGNQ